MQLLAVILLTLLADEQPPQPVVPKGSIQVVFLPTDRLAHDSMRGDDLLVGYQTVARNPATAKIEGAGPITVPNPIDKTIRQTWN